MRVRFVRGLGALAAAAGAAVALADDGVPRILLDLSLEPHPVRLVSIDSRSLTYTDPRGLVRTEGLDQFFALLPDPAGAPAAPAPGADSPPPAGPRLPTGMVDLADGQRFAGAPTGNPGDEAAMEWKTVEFGGVLIPLELVRRVSFRPPGSVGSPAASGPSAHDTLILANGDILDGFVESIGDPTRIEHDGTPVDVPMERIAGVQLGGPSKAPAGIMVWLRTGTVALVSGLSTTRGGRLTLDLGAMESTEGAPLHTATVPLDQLAGAAFDASRLAPLGAIAPTKQAGAPDRVYGEPLRVGPAAGAMLGAPDIEFPGPMSVMWTLPARASRLGGVAVLPEDCRTWGDCVLVMSVADGAGGAREVLRVRLNGAAPRAEFHVPLPADRAGATLTATVEAGEYGPIQDRVILERAVLLVGEGQVGSRRK